MGKINQRLFTKQVVDRTKKLFDQFSFRQAHPRSYPFPVYKYFPRLQKVIIINN